MQNITNSFNEIIIGKTLTNHQTYTKQVSNNEFSSLINNDSDKQEDTQKESSVNVVSQQVELQNLSYLNKALLFSVA